MKIVYIDDFFHPDAGYHINLLSKYWSLFGNEVIIFTAEAEKTPEDLKSFFDYSGIEKKDRDFETKNKVKIERVPIWGVVSGRAVYKKTIFRKIRQYNPDIVYCNGNDSLIGMQLILKSRRANYGLVLDSHMLKIASKNKFRNVYYHLYQRLITPIILKRKIPVIRTQDDDFIEECLGIPLSLSPLISFGSDTLNFHPDNNVRKQFRHENGISQDAFVVVYAGKLNSAKGVELLRDALLEPFNTNREIVFVIVGTVDSSIDNAESYFDNSQIKMVRFPTQCYTDLPKFYQASDIAIFPRQCSLSFFDVQACGLPVVFEDNQLNKTRALNGNALLFKQGDVTDFRRKVCEYANMDAIALEDVKNNAINYIKENYDYRDKALEYLPILESQLQ